MIVKSILNAVTSDLKYMRVEQSISVPDRLQAQSKNVGELIARLRVARGIKQTEAAIRAGISRNTAYRLEKGDPGLAFGQILRYLDAIAPGTTLEMLFEQKDPALLALAVRERRTRVRDMSAQERDELNF